MMPLNLIQDTSRIMMKNSDQFLNYYNLIDAFLRENNNQDPTLSFSQKLKRSDNPVIKKAFQELISFGELRNAIVHTPRIELEVIAEPHERIVQRIKILYEQITEPKKVFPEFKMDVLGENIDAFINNILTKMKQHSFSQFPVLDSDGRVCEIINTNTIARWLSSNMEKDGTILCENVKVGDLLSEIEYKNNYKFIRRDASIYEAYELFIKQINGGKNLDAIFITNSGNRSEKLLGIITIEDIANKI